MIKDRSNDLDFEVERRDIIRLNNDKISLKKSKQLFIYKQSLSK